MKTIFQWLVTQLSTQWIAILTAISSFIVWKHKNTKIIFEPGTESEPLYGLLLNDGRSIIDDQRGMQHLTTWIINPSDHDVSFYDLRITVGTKEMDVFTMAKFNIYNDLAAASAQSAVTCNNDGTPGSTIAIDIPISNHGTIPSHGFVQLDLVFAVDAPSEDGMIVLKLAESRNLWNRIRSARWVPKWMSPKMGYVHSETESIARSFCVKEVIKPKIPDDLNSDEQ